MHLKLLMAALCTTLVISACSSPSTQKLDPLGPGIIDLAAQDFAFLQASQQAMSQFTNKKPQGIIPADKMITFLNIVNEAKHKNPKINPDKLTPIEVSQLITLDELKGKRQENMKSFIVWAVRDENNWNRFEWSVIAAVDMKEWKVIDYKINMNFGENLRSKPPMMDDSLPLLIDYVYAAGPSPEYKNFGPYHAVKRVYVPKIAGQKISLDDIKNEMMIYFPGKTQNQRYVIDKDLSIYQLQTDADLSALSINSLTRVGQFSQVAK